MKVRKNPLKSRKFWMAVFGVVFVLITEIAGVEIPEDSYWVIVSVIIGYIIGESAVDIVTQMKLK